MKDYLKNFGMIIPTSATVTEDKWDKKYGTFDELMLDATNPFNWCDAERCACMGCVNNWITCHGFKKEDWDEWIVRNPAPPKDDGVGFKTFRYDSFEAQKSTAKECLENELEFLLSLLNLLTKLKNIALQGTIQQRIDTINLKLRTLNNG